MTDESDKKTGKRAIRAASASLAIFGVLTIVALGAWFRNEPSPWRWTSFVATLSAAFGVVLAVLVLRKPSRKTVAAGIAVMLFSLLRIVPGTWTGTSYSLVAVTALLLIPLVHAVIILPRSAP